MIFSLVLATYGRFDPVDAFLSSLRDQQLSCHCFEVIIVDQNDDIALDPIIDRHKSWLNVKHIKTKAKGLSLSRNIGLRYASGRYVGFPDDDCTYYPDTLLSVLRYFNCHRVDTLCGAIRDRHSGKNIIRDWPLGDKKLSVRNFFFLSSSITVFTRHKHIRFDEQLGAGCYFGACEDSEYFYTLLADHEIHYCSDIEVWHPQEGLERFSQSKNRSYGLGFGAFCGKHWRDPAILWLFVLAVAFHLLKGLLGLLQGNRTVFERRRCAGLYRIKGFIQYLGQQRRNKKPPVESRWRSRWS